MNTAPTTLGGQWGLAVIMIVIGAWVVFKYLVPKSYKEWRNAGLIQALCSGCLYPPKKACLSWCQILH